MAHSDGEGSDYSFDLASMQDEDCVPGSPTPDSLFFDANGQRPIENCKVEVDGPAYETLNKAMSKAQLSRRLYACETRRRLVPRMVCH